MEPGGCRWSQQPATGRVFCGRSRVAHSNSVTFRKLLHLYWCMCSSRQAPPDNTYMTSCSLHPRTHPRTRRPFIRTGMSARDRSKGPLRGVFAGGVGFVERYRQHSLEVRRHATGLDTAVWYSWVQRTFVQQHIEGVRREVVIGVPTVSVPYVSRGIWEAGGVRVGRKAYVERRVARLRIPCLHGSRPLARVS